MHCWNCGARNPEDFTFCGRCGKRIASASSASQFSHDDTPAAPPVTVTPPIAADVPPVQTNPLTDEPRVVHDSPRELAQSELREPVTIAAVPEAPTREVRPAENVRPNREPNRDNVYQLPANRITGPSFLGLSDPGSSSEYLLNEEEPERSSWRGWLAVAVLALLSFLVYKQWNAVSAGAREVAGRATGEVHNKAANPTPPSAVSNSDQVDPAENQTAANKPPANPQDTKPENDRGNDAAQPAESAAPSKAAESSSSAPAATAKTAEPPDTTADTTKNEPASAASSDETARPTHPDAAPARAAAKSKREPVAPEPRYDDSRIEQATRYLRGEGVPQDCARGISLLRSSAREGNPRAQVKLGALYATGQCVTQDRAAAYQWLARAQETQPQNSYLQRTMNSLWTNMTPEERGRITK